jgi:hypothetical protein
MNPWSMKLSKQEGILAVSYCGEPVIDSIYLPLIERHDSLEVYHFLELHKIDVEGFINIKRTSLARL